MLNTTAPAPAPYIDADTYVGRHTVRTNQRSDVFTARELVDMFGVGKVAVLWEFFGHVGGRRLFGRTRFVGQADGSLRGYDGDGVCKIIHPADRGIRILTN